jgi:hypothetical protein
VLEHRVHHFGAPAADLRHERALDPADNLLPHFGVVVPDLLGEAQKGPHRCHDGGAAARGQNGVEQVHDLEALLFVGGDVPGDELQDLDLGELGELVDAVEQVEHDGPVQRHPGGHDLVQNDDAVANDGRVGVAQHIVQDVDESPLVKDLGVQVVQLERPHDGRLAHVRVPVLEAATEGLANVLDHGGQIEAAQRP